MTDVSLTDVTDESLTTLADGSLTNLTDYDLNNFAQDNKTLKSYQNPNSEAKILERYNKYIDSEERLIQIRKILLHSKEGASKPSGKEMTELGKIAMGEVITSTGCCPVVVYRLLVGAYVGK